jgi:hypothetical protein
MKYYKVTIAVDEKPAAVYMVDKGALIMVARVAEQAQAAILKAIVLEDENKNE